MEENKDLSEEELKEIAPVLTPPGTAVIRIHPELDVVFDALREQAKKLYLYAEARVILNDTDVKTATDDLAVISKVKKAIEEKRAEYVKPLNDHVKMVNETFKSLSGPVEGADKITRDKILKYRAGIERKRIEAEAINQAKIDLARREAELNHGEITVDTTPVAVPEAPPAKIVAEAGNAGIAKTWKFDVTDFALLPDEYKLPDLVKIGRVVRAGVSIPGVKSWQEDTLRISTR